MIRTYFNQMAVIWDETAVEKDEVKLKLMAQRLNIKPGSSVLDVGTGTGVRPDNTVIHRPSGFRSAADDLLFFTRKMPMLRWERKGSYTRSL